jgi:16S rRNA processing protein RimM
MPGAPDQKWVTVGVVGAPHGVKGAVHVITALKAPADLRRYSPLTLKDGRSLEVANVKQAKGNRVIAAFKDVTTRDQAQALTHEELRIVRERLPKLKGEDFYHADLIGLQALKTSGEKLGQVIAVHNFGAGDIIEIKTGHDTMMVAFTKDFVPEVDLDKNRLTVSDTAIIR